ncbi:MAG TPA: tetratricopeptide repeat protein [Bryobacteraceae bacterium]|nr:tetratricopeptide repeat protein [Bryobacteraceae bacterium]
MKKAAGVCILLLAISACTTKSGYVEKGNLLFEQGKYEDAAINYRKAIQKDPNFGDAYYRLGLTAIKQENSPEAYNALFRASQLLPGNTQVKEKFAAYCFDYYLRDPRRPQKLYQQIQQAASELVAQDPNSFEGLRLLGSLAHEDRKPQDAIADFRKALLVRPWNPQVTTLLVETLLEDGRYPEAERTALELVAREKTYGPIYDVLYTFYSNANRVPESENIAKLKVANNPKRASYIVQLAGHYTRVQKPAEARAALQTLLDNPTDFPDAQLRVGDFYLAERDYPQAIRYYEAAGRANPKDQAGLEKRSLVALLANAKYDDASRMVDQILQANPKDEIALRMRADLLINTRKPENGAAAAQILQNLVNLHPNESDPALRLNLGRAYLLKGDLGPARTEFEEALRQRRDFAAAQYELSRLYAAERKPADALQAANAAVALRPTDRHARLLQAWSLASTGDAARARAILLQLIKESPKDTQARLQLGILSLKLGNFREAIDILQELRQDGDPSAVSSLAAAYVGLRQFDKAQETLSDALKQSPGSAVIQEELAETTALAGNYALAEVQFKKLIEQDPKSAQLRLRLGEVDQAKGDQKSAILYYKQAHDLAPNEATPALILADALVQAGRIDEAKALYLQIVRAHPDNLPALNNAAYFLCDHGDLNEAQKLAERALAKAPGQPGFSDTLGYVYLKKGERDTAIRTFSDLVRRYPTFSIFHYHLGLALYQKGDHTAAKKELQRALASHPGSNLEPSIKQLLGKIS